MCLSLLYVRPMTYFGWSQEESLESEKKVCENELCCVVRTGPVLDYPCICRQVKSDVPRERAEVCNGSPRGENDR